MSLEMSEALGEATPQLPSMPEPPAATPQLVAPEVAAPDQQLPAAAEADEWMDVPDPDKPGERYTQIPKNPEKLGKWLIDRNRTFSDLNAEKLRLEGEVQALRNQTVQPQPQQAPQGPPQPVSPHQDPEIVELARSYFNDYSQRYEGDQETIWAHALRDAQVEINAERRALARIDEREFRKSASQILDQNPVLQSAFGRQVYDKYGPRTPQAHLMLVKQEAAEQGVDLSQYGLRPTLSAATRTSVESAAAARTAGLSAPAVQSLGAPVVSKAPDQRLVNEYHNMVATGNYSDAQKKALWSNMVTRYDQNKQGAA